MLSDRERKLLRDAITDRQIADQIADMIDSGANAVGTDVGDVVSADAVDLATAITLANDTKAQVNLLLASLRTAGIIA